MKLLKLLDDLFLVTGIGYRSSEKGLGEGRLQPRGWEAQASRHESDKNSLQRRYGYPSNRAEAQNNESRPESERKRLRTRYDYSPILTINNNICRTNVFMWSRDQNSQPQALTTDHVTWHCINVFLNAYRKTSPVPCLATYSLSCMQYSWHDWTCNSSQFTMQQFKRFMHESFLCLMVVVVSCVCCTNTPTN